MAKTKISEFSATPANNTDIDSINIAEGCAPSGINDAIRELMAQLKDFQTGAVGDSFNGPVGTSTAAAGAFTTLSASSTVSGTGFSTYLASPPAIGGTAAAAVSATTLSASSTLSVTGAGSIQGLTVGRGAGAVSTNTAVGDGALSANTTGAGNTAVGYQAGDAITTGSFNVVIGRLSMDNSAGVTGDQNTAVGNGTLRNVTSGTLNTAVGSGALSSTTTGANNTAVGQSALTVNTTASNNTAVGYQAGYTNVTGGSNVFIGQVSGYSSTGSENCFLGVGAGYSSTGSFNTFVGRGTGTAAGSSMTTGSKNTILGGYNGNQSGIDIRTGSNYVVLSDGDGTPLAYTYAGATFCLQGAGYPQTGTGITFPATQSASSNANTLDDYEEGTFTATLTCTTSGTITLGYNTLYYTKIGRQVTILGYLSVNSVSSPVGNVQLNGLPFTVLGGNIARPVLNIRADGLTTGATTSIIGELSENTTAGTIFKYSAGSVAALAGNVQAGSNLVLSATYFV